MHRLLLVCHTEPLSAAQLLDRYMRRWVDAPTESNLRTCLSRLWHQDYLARPDFGIYVLSEKGQTMLAALDAPPPPLMNGGAAELLRSLLDGTYTPEPGEHHATFSAEALDRVLDLLETAGTAP